ncbi:hypothetical protein KPH14_001893 [Odynerus spinipes]|uniref:Ig-like domain-containing protein n=1 Tax=Odynerus spinipes TaxID=1348599 RepID=A0AAD9S244_9HYME|nr:hypothetical protein KPH14_001893 [Odynerus spinipes]
MRATTCTLAVYLTKKEIAKARKETACAGEGAQYFRFKPRNSSVLEGGEVIIPCEVENRVGIVQWVKDGFAYVIQPNGEIVGHPRLRLIGDQNAGIYNLKITDASLTDDGEYQCQVGPYLRIKPIRANAHLIVICKYTPDESLNGFFLRLTVPRFISFS